MAESSRAAHVRSGGHWLKFNCNPISGSANIQPFGQITKTGVFFQGATRFRILSGGVPPVRKIRMSCFRRANSGAISSHAGIRRNAPVVGGFSRNHFFGRDFRNSGNRVDNVGRGSCKIYSPAASRSISSRRSASVKALARSIFPCGEELSQIPLAFYLAIW